MLYFLYVRLVIPCYGRCIEMGIPLYCFWFQQGSAYPGCQRLFMRGFQFRSSLKTCRPGADTRRKLLVAREKKPLVPREGSAPLPHIFTSQLLLRLSHTHVIVSYPNFPKNYDNCYPGCQRFFSRSVGIKGPHILGRRPKPRAAKLFARVTIKTWNKPETALEKSLAPRVDSCLTVSKTFRWLPNIQIFRKMFSGISPERAGFSVIGPGSRVVSWGCECHKQIMRYRRLKRHGAIPISLHKG